MIPCKNEGFAPQARQFRWIESCLAITIAVELTVLRKNERRHNIHLVDRLRDWHFGRSTLPDLDDRDCRQEAMAEA